MPEQRDFRDESRAKRSSKPRGEAGDEMEESKAAIMRRAARSAKAPEPAYVGEYKVASGDTLSGIALQYYGSAAKEKWMAIYEANKDVIGDNPSLIRPDQVLKIPKLPE